MLSNTIINMTKYFTFLLTIFAFHFNGCSNNNNNTIIFGTSAEYPPFEYVDHAELKGFDIDLAKLIAERMKKKAEFKDMQFSNLFQALNANQIDIAISTITITEERKKNFDFSDPYYFSSIAAVYHENDQINNLDDLKNKKISCQIGTTMESWIHSKLPDNELILINNNNQAIELLKNHYVDAIIIDEFQGKKFSKQYKTFSWSIIDESENGYGMAFKKKSKLKDQINKTLIELENDGEIKKLQKIWLNK